MMKIEKLKKCSKCGEEKEIHCFKYDNRFSDKISSTCIECQGGTLSTETKQCDKCGETKFLHQFRRNKSGETYKYSCSCCVCEASKERDKYWNTDLREKSIAKCKRRREQNCESDKERCNKYKQEHKQKLKEYVSANKERDKLRHKEFLKDPENRKRVNERNLKRLHEDEQYRITQTLRSRLRTAFKESDCKKEKTSLQYGVSFKDLAEYLEPIKPNIEHPSIDHIVPCKSFDLTKDEHVRICFSKENLRWCSFEENSSKCNYIIPDLIRKHKIEHICEFLEINLSQYEENNHRLDKYNKQED